MTGPHETNSSGEHTEYLKINNITLQSAYPDGIINAVFQQYRSDNENHTILHTVIQYDFSQRL